jgi:hypothetical protein
MSIAAQRRPHSAQAPLHCRDMFAALVSRPLPASGESSPDSGYPYFG